MCTVGLRGGDETLSQYNLQISSQPNSGRARQADHRECLIDNQESCGQD